MRVLLLASALVLSQAPRKASVCTDIDFDTADVTVSNFGDDKYCCNLCNKDDASLLCCPTLDKDGTTARAIYICICICAHAPRSTKRTPSPHPTPPHPSLHV